MSFATVPVGPVGPRSTPTGVKLGVQLHSRRGLSLVVYLGSDVCSDLNVAAHERVRLLWGRHVDWRLMGVEKVAPGGKGGRSLSRFGAWLGFRVSLANLGMVCGAPLSVVRQQPAAFVREPRQTPEGSVLWAKPKWLLEADVEPKEARP